LTSKGKVCGPRTIARSLRRNGLVHALALAAVGTVTMATDDGVEATPEEGKDTIRLGR
jgi:hypothetical protein